MEPTKEVLSGSKITELIDQKPVEEKSEKNKEKNEKDKNIEEIKDFLSGNYGEPLEISEEEPIRKETRGRKKGSTKNKLQGNENKIYDNPVITGSIFILLLDLALPNLIAFANNRFTKKKIKASQMQMSASQREQMTPIADAAASQLMLQANPVTILIISLFGIYGFNYMQQIQ